MKTGVSRVSILSNHPSPGSQPFHFCQCDNEKKINKQIYILKPLIQHIEYNITLLGNCVQLE